MRNSSSPQPKSPLTPLYKGGEGEGVKAIIAEIEAIYRDHNYQPRGKALGDYSEAQLAGHLEKLQAGACEWMKGKAKSPLTPLCKGGEGEGITGCKPVPPNQV
jgi:hypothetical protein